MKKRLSTFWVILITATVTFVLTLSAFVLWQIFRPAESYSAVISEIKAYIDRYAVFDFSQDEAEKAAINGYLSGLDDDYTQYWTPEEYQEYLSSVEGNFSGIGITLQSADPVTEGLLIYRVLGNSPAEAAGLLAGDLIVGVNGVSILNKSYDDAFNSIAGDAGETVVLTILRDGSKTDVSVTFSQFVQSYVEYRMIGEIGFIRIHSFMEPVVSEFQTALNELLSQGAKGLVFDLRNNLGGGLDVVISVLDFLVPKGEELVVLKFKDSEEIHYAELDAKTDVPMVVLMNESSASASELMASCLRDIRGSLLIGTNSFGKGIGQTTFSLSDQSAFKMTTFYYLTKNRVNYHGKGLEPDVRVDLTEEQTKYFYTLDETSDLQLQEALRQLQTQIG